jgi:hypothetical protein
MKLQIHIERLVLEGLPVNGAGGHHVQGAVQAELAWLLSQAGLAHELQSGGAVPRLKTAEIAMTRDDKPTELGERIAQAIHGAIAAKSPQPGHRAGKLSISTKHRSMSAKGNVK